MSDPCWIIEHILNTIENLQVYFYQNMGLFFKEMNKKGPFDQT